MPRRPRRSGGTARSTTAPQVNELNEGLIAGAEWYNVPRVINMLEQGADVHTNNDQALYEASNKGFSDIVEILLRAGADVHANDDRALKSAAGRGSLATVELLLRAGANVHAGEETALIWAASSSHTDVVEVLLRAGADIHSGGDLALEQAALYGNANTVRVLLRAGADVRARSDAALRAAQANGNTDVIRVLGGRPRETAANGDEFTMYREMYLDASAARTDAATLTYPSAAVQRVLPPLTPDWAALLRGDTEEHVIVKGQSYYMCMNRVERHHYDAQYYAEYCKSSTTLPTPLDGRQAKVCLLCPYCKNKMDTQMYVA